VNIGVKKAKPAPTPRDVKLAERRLRSMKSQLKIDEYVESGTQRATHANFLRAKTVFPYYENSIFEISTAPDRMTVIQLQPSETITGNKPKAADTVQWQVDTVSSGDGNDKIINILIKPLSVDLETNLFVATNKRVYYFSLRSDSEAFMPLVAFNYPEEASRASEAKSLDAQDKENNQESIGVRPENLNTKYTIEGDSVEWKPVAVYDDGHKTYLQMPQEMKNYEAPALFVIEDDSAPLLVNYRVKKQIYIVDRLFNTAQLLVGTDKKVEVARNGSNKSFSFWD
jgi:type IV secretion system protein VirB9